MSKKKLLEFGLKEADAFQKNFKIIFDRLVRGYRSVMGKDPEGLDLLKVKMEAREKALETTKVVNQKGLTLDPDKPIMGGTQEGIPTIKTKFDEELTVGVDTIKDQMDKIKSTSSKLDEVMKEREAMFKPKSDTDEFNLSKDDPMGDLEKILKGEGDTGLPKGPSPFGDNIRDAYRKAGRSREDATEMIEALDSPGAKKSYEIMEEALGVRLYGDETFEELMKIKETGMHPRGEPPLKKADGGRINFALGGPTDREGLQNIIGVDLLSSGPGLLDGEEDEFADIQGQTAGFGLFGAASKALQGLFGSKVGSAIFENYVRRPAINKSMEGIKKANQIAYQKRLELEEKIRQASALKAAQKEIERMGYTEYGSGGGRDASLNLGPGGTYTGMGDVGATTANTTGDFATDSISYDLKDGGLATMFVERR